MSEWITDRLPKKDDTNSDILGDKEHVWVWRKSRWDSQSHEQVFTDCWCDVEPGTPWAPIITLPPPEPYVEPHTYTVLPHLDGSGYWRVTRKGFGDVLAQFIPDKESAERIAKIFREMMP